MAGLGLLVQFWNLSDVLACTGITMQKQTMNSMKAKSKAKSGPDEGLTFSELFFLGRKSIRMASPGAPANHGQIGAKAILKEVSSEPKRSKEFIAAAEEVLADLRGKSCAGRPDVFEAWSDRSWEKTEEKKAMSYEELEAVAGKLYERFEGRAGPIRGLMKKKDISDADIDNYLKWKSSQ